MILRHLSRRIAAFAVLCGTAGLAHATAQLGGALSLGVNGGCRFDALVPLTTLQDTFVLAGATPSLPGCGGLSVSGALRGDAASPAVGLKIVASGPNTPAAAQVSLVDEWIITPPAGTAAGPVLFPVILTLDGLVAPGSVFQAATGRFLDYTLAISDKYNGLDPLYKFRTDSQITTTGPASLSFSGTVAIRNYNTAAIPMTAVVQLGLSVPNLLAGTVDVFNTASLTMTLPPGFTAVTSSGLPLRFATPVPEPGTNALWALGLFAIGVAVRQRWKAPVATDRHDRRWLLSRQRCSAAVHWIPAGGGPTRPALGALRKWT